MIFVKFLIFYENFLLLLYLSYEKRIRYIILVKFYKINNFENI